MICRLCGFPVRTQRRHGTDPRQNVCEACRSKHGLAPAARRPAQRLTEEVAYDPAFRAAVAEGQLSPLEAFHRGSRDGYAGQLVQRFGLDPDVAFAVADNRISLHRARRATIAAALTQPAGARPPLLFAERGKRVLFALTSLAILLAAAHARLAWQRYVEESRDVAVAASLAAARERQAATALAEAEAEAEAESIAEVPGEAGPRTDVQRGSAGEVVAVSGPDPQSVLERFCEETSDQRVRQPIELVQRFTGSLIGIYEDDTSPGRRFAIPIRRETGTRRWIASGGEHALELLAVEHTSAGLTAERVPIATP